MSDPLTRREIFLLLSPFGWESLFINIQIFERRVYLRQGLTMASLLFIFPPTVEPFQAELRPSKWLRELFSSTFANITPSSPLIFRPSDITLGIPSFVVMMVVSCCSPHPFLFSIYGSCVFATFYVWFFSEVSPFPSFSSWSYSPIQCSQYCSNIPLQSCPDSMCQRRSPRRYSSFSLIRFYLSLLLRSQCREIDWRPPLSGFCHVPHFTSPFLMISCALCRWL